MCQMCCLKKEQMETCKHKNTMSLRSIKDHKRCLTSTHITVLNSFKWIYFTKWLSTYLCFGGLWGRCSSNHRVFKLLYYYHVSVVFSAPQIKSPSPPSCRCGGRNLVDWTSADQTENCLHSWIRPGNMMQCCDFMSRKWEIRNTCWLKEHELNVSSLL